MVYCGLTGNPKERNSEADDNDGDDDDDTAEVFLGVNDARSVRRTSLYFRWKLSFIVALNIPALPRLIFR